MSILDDIISGVRSDVARRRERVSFKELLAQLPDDPALNPMEVFRSKEISIIAEVKRRSPSKGELAEIPDPATLAYTYQLGGASAVSVLTEERRFGGSLTDLDAVRAKVTIPILRKDFMVDDYQFVESRVHGADLVLLIVAALNDDELSHFLALARELTMTPLVEVHTVDEASRAMACGAELIGINNRNLHTLEVDLQTFARVSEYLEGVVKVAESGIFTVHDVALVRDAGADVILVGEALVRHSDPAQAIRAFTAC